MSAEDIEAHIRACGMNTKKYNKIEGVVKRILVKNPGITKDSLLTMFAKKCYGNFAEAEGKKQARKFLKVLYEDLDVVVKQGPAYALEQASQGNKGKKMMRIVRLNKPIDGFTKKLDRYLVGETIGKGATSVVKRGRREGEQKEEVAIKILTVDGKSFQLEELMKEIEVLRVLDHKNVIKMHDCFENVQYPGYTEKPTVVMILELATKGELFDFFMHTGKFEAPLARWFFKQMIDGLEYCHSKKIAHRDLKPENLLMGEGFNVKLVDFGFARFFRDEKTGKEVKMCTALGTPGYAAPEILNRKKYDYSVDIFSLGVILFICIAGFPPFQEAKHSDWWFDKIIKKKYALFWKAHERSMKFDDNAKDILLGMLAAKPADRYGWEKLRNHKWTNEKTLTQDQASQALMKLKREVDKKMAENATSSKKVDEKRVQRALEDGEFDAPVLGNFLPVHHIFTSMRGQLAREYILDSITTNMHGEIKMVKTDLWVGPVPAEGLEKTVSGDNAAKDLYKEEEMVSDAAKEDKPKEKNKGQYWDDMEFTLNLDNQNKDDEKADTDEFGVPLRATNKLVRGTVIIRRHPTRKTEEGNPLNVVYLKRLGSVLPFQWWRVSNAILNGVSNIMYTTTTKCFKGSNNDKITEVANAKITETANDQITVTANSGLSTLLCCSTGTVEATKPPLG